MGASAGQDALDRATPPLPEVLAAARLGAAELRVWDAPVKANLHCSRQHALLRAARESAVNSRAVVAGGPAADERRLRAACARVRKGEVSRAHQLLTPAELAPGTEATWEALTDSSDVMEFTPDTYPHITPEALAVALRTSKRGSAPGLSGMRAEQFQVLQDEDGLELLAYAGTCLARAEVPAEVVAALALARPQSPPQTKPNGGLRGTAGLARSTQPFQYALQTCAGTDALVAMLRTELELRPLTTVVSLDGRSAHDCISRKVFFGKTSGGGASARPVPVFLREPLHVRLVK